METIYEQLGIQENPYSYITPTQLCNLSGFTYVLFSVEFDDLNLFTKSEINTFCKEFEITLVDTITHKTSYITNISYCMQESSIFVDNWLTNIQE
jgi:hypothetical protein